MCVSVCVCVCPHWVWEARGHSEVARVGLVCVLGEWKAQESYAVLAHSVCECGWVGGWVNAY